MVLQSGKEWLLNVGQWRLVEANRLVFEKGKKLAESQERQVCPDTYHFKFTKIDLSIFSGLWKKKMKRSTKERCSVDILKHVSECLVFVLVFCVVNSNPVLAYLLGRLNPSPGCTSSPGTLGTICRVHFVAYMSAKVSSLRISSSLRPNNLGDYVKDHRSWLKHK